MTNHEEFIITEYEEAIIMAVALCDNYKIKYEDYFKEKYLYMIAYKRKRDIFNSTAKKIYLLNLWQRMRAYFEFYEKFKNNNILKSRFAEILNNIKKIICQLDLLFSNDIIKLSEKRKELKQNAKKAYDKEYSSKKKSEKTI